MTCGLCSDINDVVLWFSSLTCSCRPFSPAGAAKKKKKKNRKKKKPAASGGADASVDVNAAPTKGPSSCWFAFHHLHKLVLTELVCAPSAQVVRELLLVPS